MKRARRIALSLAILFIIAESWDFIDWEFWTCSILVGFWGQYFTK